MHTFWMLGAFKVILSAVDPLYLQSWYLDLCHHGEAVICGLDSRFYLWFSASMGRGLGTKSPQMPRHDLYIRFYVLTLEHNLCIFDSAQNLSGATIFELSILISDVYNYSIFLGRGLAICSAAESSYLEEIRWLIPDANSSLFIFCYNPT